MAHLKICRYFYCGKAISDEVTLTASGILITRPHRAFDDAMAAIKTEWEKEHKDEKANIVVTALNTL